MMRQVRRSNKRTSRRSASAFEGPLDWLSVLLMTTWTICLMVLAGAAVIEPVIGTVGYNCVLIAFWVISMAAGLVMMVNVLKEL